MSDTPQADGCLSPASVLALISILETLTKRVDLLHLRLAAAELGLEIAHVPPAVQAVCLQMVTDRKELDTLTAPGREVLRRELLKPPPNEEKGKPQ